MLFFLGHFLVEFFLFVAWLVSLGLAGAGTLIGIRTLGLRPLRPSFAKPPISVLKPLKGLDTGIRGNLESFFRQRYPDWELLFSVGDENDPVIPLVRELMEKYPKVKARLFIGDVPAGINPKVNNLVKPFAFAAHEWVLISDSNTRVDDKFLARLAERLTPGVALQYCVVAGARAFGLGGRLDAISLNTMYARGTLLTAAGGFPCVTGKAMLLRKSVLEELGGIRAFAPEVAEDFVIGQAFQRLGHRVVMSMDPVRQFVGRGSVAAYWSRTVRWGRIRKLHAPKALFLLEPFLLTSVGSGIAGALAMHLAFRAPLLPVLAWHFVLWGFFDAALARALGQKLGWKDAVAWALRELLHPLQWAHIAIGDTVEWRGEVLKMERSGILERIAVG